MVITVEKLIAQAGLGIVEIVWFMLAMQHIVPEEGKLRLESVKDLPWSMIEPALGAWYAEDLNEDHREVVGKIRLAASDLLNEEEIGQELEDKPRPPFDEVTDQLNKATGVEDRAGGRGWAEGLSYEAGVANALRWVLGETKDKPMEDE